ncbi:HvfC/BufC family peptide modification chaperone [Azospirillum sp. sgz302134]
MLRDLQAAMRRELLSAGTGLPPGVVDDDIPAPLRFAIYANNVVGSLVEALEAAFPMTARLLGDAAFRSAALRFVRRHPPRVPHLLAYGDRFPGHLDRAVPGCPAAGEMARFEWAWNTAYFAADAPILDIATLRALPAERYATLRLALHPSAHLLTCAWAVLDLWDALRLGESPAPAAEPQRILPQYILIVRPLLEVQSVTLGPGELTLLMALSAGADLSHAALAAAGTEAGFDLQSTLLAHLQLGTFTAFTTANPNSTPNSTDEA